MREKLDLPATSSVSPPHVQDWARWLRHARHDPPSSGPPSSPASADAAWRVLIHLARRQGFTVERANCAAADGFTTWRNRKIRIRPDATTAHAVIALAHQLGHVLLHDQTARHEPSGTIPCAGIRKVEADSVAYLTAAHLSIDATQIAFPHPPSWAGTDPRARPAQTIQTVTTRILTATATITTLLDTAGVTGAPPAAPARAPAQPEAAHRAGPSAHTEELARIHDDAAQFFCNQGPGSWVPSYLTRRGLSHSAQEPWQAGYAPAAWDDLTCHLRAAGYLDPVIEASGLAHCSRRGTLIDTFRDRAMLPIRSPDGTIIAFIGRAADHADPDTPKYLNSPATALYDKSEVLFGLWESRDALAAGARPVLVEGPLDAIAVTTAAPGRYAGLAPCGTALTARHAAALAQAADLPATGVTVAFDPDEPGQRAAVRACPLLIPHTDRLAAVILPKGQDPASVLVGSGPAALAEMLTRRARPLPDLVINAELRRWTRRRLREAEGQIGALRAAAPLIAAMPPAHAARQVARLAAALRLDHATVTQAVTDALTTLVNHPPHTSATHHHDLHERSPAGQDFLHSAQQAIERMTGAEPTPARPKRPRTDQPQLTSSRIRG